MIGRQIGKLMYEFRKASNDFKFQMEEELRNAEEADRRKKEEEERQRQLAAAPPAQLGTGDTAAPQTPAASEISDPYGSTYGEVMQAQAEAQAETAYPDIQPPSTGEPVPAAQPGSAAVEAQETNAAEAPEANSENNLRFYALPAAVEEKISVEKENATIETAVEEANKATEPAAHNG
jgi:sec-independent protein translocase protein TatB